MKSTILGVVLFAGLLLIGWIECEATEVINPETGQSMIVFEDKPRAYDPRTSEQKRWDAAISRCVNSKLHKGYTWSSADKVCASEVNRGKWLKKRRR